MELTCHRCHAVFVIMSADAWGWTVAIRTDGSYGKVLCTACMCAEGFRAESPTTWTEANTTSQEPRDENHENPNR